MASAVLTNVGSILSKFRPVVFAHLQAKSFASVIHSMEKHEVVPDVIPVAPKEACEVSFDPFVSVVLSREWYILHVIRSKYNF